MSTLVVEVCIVSALERHPQADRLGIATIKGWRTVIGFDPASGEFEFAVGEKCVYFPPDAVLPPALANSPHKVCRNKSCGHFGKTPAQLGLPAGAVCGKCGEALLYKDGTPGRTGAMAFCAPLPKHLDGTRPPGGRVRAARIRGVQSFGFIMKLDAAHGDDPAWPAGTDVRAHFGVGKWEPPLEAADGETEPAHPAFHTYTDIEHMANHPGVLRAGEEVVITEKLHGKNCRVGLMRLRDENGAASWQWMAGSHGQRRREWFATVKRFDAADLAERSAIPDARIEIGRVFVDGNGKSWRAVDVPQLDLERKHFRAEEVIKNPDGAYEARLRQSEFWEPLTPRVKAMLEAVRDEHTGANACNGIVLFGELYGTQDMKYGLKNQRGFRAFDLAINGRYVDFDTRQTLCARFDVETVPVLYRGPFDAQGVVLHTDGPTTMCATSEAGAFGGREGVVVTPVVERIADEMIPTGTRGRVIFKSISADYLARKGGTDAH